MDFQLSALSKVSLFNYLTLQNVSDVLGSQIRFGKFFEFVF
jgi:hypothetical protein